jgi:hypothetical protein
MNEKNICRVPISIQVRYGCQPQVKNYLRTHTHRLYPFHTRPNSSQVRISPTDKKLSIYLSDNHPRIAMTN